MPGKPPGMDPIGIMGRHDGTGVPWVRRGAGGLPRPELQLHRWARLSPGLPSEGIHGQVSGGEELVFQP